MKKRLLKLTLSMSAILTLISSFSSCLGDSDSSFELSNNFVYIASDDIREYAINTNQIMVSSEGLRSKLSAGDCAIISFKVNTGSASSGIYEAENLQIVDEFYRMDQATVNPMAPNPSPMYPVYPKTLKINSATPGDFMGDRWLFAINYEDESDSKFVPEFYYDANNQFETVSGESEQVALKANQVILDVRFVKKNYNTGSKSDKTESFVANLSGLKTYYTKVDYNAADAVEYDSGLKAVPVYIKFRYYTDPTKDPVYLGSAWNQQNGYYVYFFQGKY